jgi:hypothetical protein
MKDFEISDVIYTLDEGSSKQHPVYDIIEELVTQGLKVSKDNIVKVYNDLELHFAKHVKDSVCALGLSGQLEEEPDEEPAVQQMEDEPEVKGVWD